MKIEVIEIQPDETMVTTEGRESRYLRLDPLERLFRKGLLTDDQYRVGRCLQADHAAMQSMGGGSSLRRCGDAFVLMGGGRSGCPVIGQEHALQAAERVAASRERVGADTAFLVLLELLQGYTPSDLDQRWFKKRAKGMARDTVLMALERLVDCKVYETLRHRAAIWAERVA